MTDQNEAAKTSDKTEGRFGVLVRGRVYYLRNKVFERGVPVPVSEEEEEYLKEHAVDEVTVEDEFEHQPRQKFKFLDASEVDDEDKPKKSPAAKGKPPTRRRRR